MELFSLFLNRSKAVNIAEEERDQETNFLAIFASITTQAHLCQY